MAAEKFILAIDHGTSGVKTAIVLVAGHLYIGTSSWVRCMVSLHNSQVAAHVAEDLPNIYRDSVDELIDLVERQ
ncbi:MAG: hypothetical protein SWC96_09540 [Thermodesulfobacteriota bacterium]|nr:hypothetical protein [Thermodesulfobacteriota bacterium]